MPDGPGAGPKSSGTRSPKGVGVGFDDVDLPGLLARDDADISRTGEVTRVVSKSQE